MISVAEGGFLACDHSKDNVLRYSTWRDVFTAILRHTFYEQGHFSFVQKFRLRFAVATALFLRDQIDFVFLSFSLDHSSYKFMIIFGYQYFVSVSSCYVPTVIAANR